MTKHIFAVTYRVHLIAKDAYEILSDLFCIPISTGKIHKMTTEYAKKVVK